jgi:hypothetical protein
MQRANLDNSYYGGWVERVADWRLKCPRDHEANVQEIHEEKQGRASPSLGGTGGEDTSEGPNAAEELTRILASTELNVDESELCNKANAEAPETQDSAMLEPAEPLAAVLPTTQLETTGTSAQRIEKGLDLTVDELEEMLREKRKADKKSQGKTDIKERKSMKTRSASLRQNTENKQ